MSNNYFAELAKIDVSEHIEKKGRFNYLSWPFAIEQLRKNHPDATWEVKRFDGMPYMKTELGYFVEVAVTVNGITLSQIHPVLNNYNKPIDNPTPFDINTSIQRCLVKAIALHGLGLYIYAGEDLPGSDKEPITQKQVGELKVRALKFAELRGQKEEASYNALGMKGVDDIEKLSAEEADKHIKKLDGWIEKAQKENESKGDKQ